MEPITVVMDRFKDFGRSTGRFVKGVMQRYAKGPSQSPIEILKRLQREAFSDLMKLRERQDKVERMLAFYQSGKAGSFQESRTHMKGVINADGALTFPENDFQQAFESLDAVGARRGINLRFILETPIRQRDLLITELLAAHCSQSNSNKNGSPLAPSKLLFLGNICDWLSAVIAPLGAQCTDFGTTHFLQGGYESSKTGFFAPPLFLRSGGCGIGFNVKGSELSVSLAGLLSGPCRSAFGQVSYKPSGETRLAMSGIWRTCGASRLLKPEELGSSASSIAMMLESQLDEATNLDCWVEMWESSPSMLRWGASLYDLPQEKLGWGFKLGGQIEGNSCQQFWLEGFLNFNLGNTAVLQPAILYALHGESPAPALLLRSSWFF